MINCPHNDEGWCNSCKEQYQARLRLLIEAHKQMRAEKAPVKQVPREARLGTLLSLAQHVGALKMKAMLSVKGLKQKQAWRAYYAMAKKLEREREAFESWAGKETPPH